MYLVLVTNKSSNILEDLEVLRMCGKVVPEYVVPLDEETVRLLLPLTRSARRGWVKC